MSISLNNIDKTFGTFPAVRGVNLEIKSGELVALLGPSGSGKSTLLRIIAGLEQPDSNADAPPHVLFDGESVAHRHVRHRGVGFVFQHYSLFRHMTVYENIAFGLRVRPRRTRPSGAEIRRRVEELLDLIQLQSLTKRYPHQLSGGQRQRVALARALAVEPAVLLLDEPFGALDARVRQDLRRWLRRLHDEIHVTSVFVTHDQDEALEISDRVVVMNNGRIEQAGTPEEIFHHPRTPFVTSFIGTTNRFQGRVNESGAQFGDIHLDRTYLPGSPDGESGNEIAGSWRSGTALELFVRPHEIDLRDKPGDLPGVPAVVERIRPAGAVVRISLITEGGEYLTAEIPCDQFDRDACRCGQRVFALFRKTRVFVA